MRPSPAPLAGLLATSLLLASPLPAERLIVRSYSVIDGLASDRIVCLVPDRDGFLWICTNAGLARFDGSRFVVFGTADGLPDPAVNHFLHTRSGSRWVSMNGGGVARLEPDPTEPGGRVFTGFEVGSTPRSMRVNVLFEARDGSLLAGTDGGLFRARYPDAEPRFEMVPLALPGFADSGLQIWGIAEDGAGRVWVGTSGGLVLLRRGARVAHVQLASVQGADHVYDVRADEAGRIWLGHDSGLFVWTPPEGDDAFVASRTALGDRATPCIVPAGTRADDAASLPGSPDSVCHWAPAGEGRGRSGIRSLLETPDGWIWMASGAGLGVFDGARLRLFDASKGLPTSALTRVAMDPGGDVWAGSNSGVHRIQRRGFTYFAAEDGLLGPALRTVLRGPDGQLYAVSTTSVIHRFDGGRWTAVRPNLPPSAGGVGRSIYGAALLDHTGAWWIGTGLGLLRFPVVPTLEALAGIEPAAHYTTDDGLAGNDIWHLFEDSRGDVWIAARIPGPQPLTRWDRDTGRFHRYGEPEGLPAERAVRAFVEDPAGSLWVSFWDGGVARLEGSRFRYFAPGVDVPAGHLYQLLVDRRGWLWVAGRQIFFTREPTALEPRFEAFRASDGQTLNALGVSEDAEGRIYAQTLTGLVRFRPEDGHVQQIGFGSPFTELQVHHHRDPDGTLWLVTDAGVLRYQPRPVRSGRPPPVRIGAVRAGDTPVPVPPLGAASLAPVRSAPGQRQIQIEYFGLGFGTDAPLRYQVRLDGVDDDWSAPTSELAVIYAGLGPGRYRFGVRAVSADGQVSAQPATLAFIVPPPFWRTTWFLAALGALLATTLAAAHRLRVRRLLELERVRTRIASDLHDDVGASLARVSLLSEATRRTLRQDPVAADRLLGEIGETSRELLSAAGDIAFSIDPGRGRLDGLVARLRRFTEDMLAGTEIDWRLTTEGETAGIVLTSDQRRHVLAILKEALHNAVRHGQPRHITLTMAVRGDLLEASLTDDGRGFEAVTCGDGAEPPAGHGLRNMRRRAGEIRGRLAIESRPGAGTRVSLRVPLRRATRMFVR